MKVVIVGSGNVATHLALAFLDADIEVSQVWSNNYGNALNLAAKVSAQAIESLNEVDNDADLLVIAIKDDAIAETLARLVHFKGIIVHTAGSVNLNVFGNKIKNFGVLYPLQTFSKDKTLDFRIIPLCVEANNHETLAFIKAVAIKLSDKVEEIDSERRKVLHLSAVFACNFTNHLYALAANLLAENDLKFDLIKPLIKETASKILTTTPKNAQTGPAVRNDEQTLKSHEAMLVKQPALLEIYKTLSNSIKKHN